MVQEMRKCRVKNMGDDSEKGEVFLPSSKDKIRAEDCTVGLSKGKGASEPCNNQLG